MKFVIDTRRSRSTRCAVFGNDGDLIGVTPFVDLRLEDDTETFRYNAMSDRKTRTKTFKKVGNDDLIKLYNDESFPSFAEGEGI